MSIRHANAEISFGRAPNVRTVRSPTRPTKLVYLFTRVQPPSDSGRNASWAGMVARTFEVVPLAPGFRRRLHLDQVHGWILRPSARTVEQRGLRRNGKGRNAYCANLFRRSRAQFGGHFPDAHLRLRGVATMNSLWRVREPQPISARTVKDMTNKQLDDTIQKISIASKIRS